MQRGRVRYRLAGSASTSLANVLATAAVVVLAAGMAGSPSAEPYLPAWLGLASAVWIAAAAAAGFGAAGFASSAAVGVLGGWSAWALGRPSLAAALSLAPLVWITARAALAEIARPEERQPDPTIPTTGNRRPTADESQRA
jgi:hypothetical protein